MAENKDSADKTEKPTAKRLRDARKKGDIAKSRELTSTVAILGWLIIIWLMTPTIFRRIEALFSLVFDSLDRPFRETIGNISVAALDVTLALLLPMMFGAALLALLTEFIQVGPIVAPSRVKPDVARLNPAEGVKRMFSQENVVEVLKSLVKTLALVGILIAVLWSEVGSFVKLTTAPPAALGKAYSHSTLILGAWVIFVFFFISVLDSIYQRFAYTKRLKMSRRDIRREHKEEEGDPYIKGRRRQLHQEWATRNLVEAVRSSNVVVTNPTHVAVAILYTPGETLVPVVAAKGEEHVAKIIREAAEEAGIPIMQNIDLARGLYDRTEIDDFVPVEFFEAVAELLRWADSIKKAKAEGLSALPEPPAPGT